MKTQTILGVKVNVVGKGTNFGPRITRAEAARLLKLKRRSLPFDLMCKEYGDDDDWVGLTADDLNEDGGLDTDWKTIEIYI